MNENETQTPDMMGSAAAAGSADYKRGYCAGYAAGRKRGYRDAQPTPQPPGIAKRVEAETGDGYTCKICGIQRPKKWFVYEVEHDGQWKTPCCALCARQNRARGPFPQNTELCRPPAENSTTP